MAKDDKNIAKIKEKMGKYNEAIRILLKHNLIIDALRLASEHESTIKQCYHVQYLASKYADKLLPSVQKSQENLIQFEAILNYLSLNQRVTYYKKAGIHKRACQVLMKECKHGVKEVFRIYKGQGLHTEGLELAKDIEDIEEEAVFIFFKVTAELSNESGKLKEISAALLKRRVSNQSDIRAKANLIYGYATNNHTKIQISYDYFSKTNVFGQIESFYAALERAKYDTKSRTWTNIHLNKNEELLSLTLTICLEIKKIRTNFLGSTDVSASIQRQFESFYGLERNSELQEVYFIPPSSYPWTNQLVKELDIEKFTTDIDGMLQLQIETVIKGACSHMESYIVKWIIDDHHKLVEYFIKAFTEHPLYQQVTAGGYLHKSYLSHSSGFQQNFFRLLCIAFDLAHHGSPKICNKNKIVKTALAALSPQATCYLPATMTSVFLPIQSESLKKKLLHVLDDIIVNSQNNLDNWFDAWRIICMSGKKSSHKMKTKLEAQLKPPHSKIADGREFQVHQRSKSKVQTSPMYIQDENDQYQHIMLLWLKTCELLENGEVLAFSKALHNIVCKLTSMKSTISISNLLNVITVNTTLILTMYATCSAQLHREGIVYIPHSYKNIIDLFFTMNGQENMDYIVSCSTNMKKFSVVPPELEDMLHIILKVMIGVYNEEFNPLRYALGRDECLKNKEAQHCLVFVLILFFNLGVINFDSQTLHAYRCQIYESVKHCKDPTLLEAYCKFINSRTLLGCLSVIKQLLETSSDTLFQAYLLFKQSEVHVEFRLASAWNSNLGQQRLPDVLPYPLAFKPAKPVIIRSSLRAEASPFIPGIGLNQASSHISGPPAESGDPLDLLSTRNTEDDDQDDDGASQAVVEITDSCNACVCKIASGDSPNISSTKASAEALYQQHCQSKEHKRNMELMRQFESTRKTSFLSTKREIHRLIQKWHSLLGYQSSQEEVEVIRNKTEEIEAKIKEFQNSGRWTAGIHLLQNDGHKEIQSLYKSMSLIIQEAERKKKDIEQEEREGLESLIEGEEPDEDVEDVILPMQTRPHHREKNKEESRKRKKRRKK